MPYCILSETACDHGHDSIEPALQWHAGRAQNHFLDRGFQPELGWLAPPLRLSRASSSFSSFLSAGDSDLADGWPGPQAALLPEGGLPVYGVPRLAATDREAQFAEAEPEIAEVDGKEPIEIRDADLSEGPDLSSPGTAPGSAVLEYWSVSGPNGEGAQLLTDGEGHSEMSHTVHEEHQDHHASHSSHHGSHQDAADHEGLLRARHEKHISDHRGQGEGAPVATIIMNNDEEKGYHLVPVVGGLIAVFGQLYFVGQCFVTLFKPNRSPSATLLTEQPRSDTGAAQRLESQQGQAGSFSGASGRPGASAQAPSQPQA